jgi:hypothetical protein
MAVRRATKQARFGSETYYNTGYNKKMGMYTRLLRVPNRMKVNGIKKRSSGGSGG